MVRIWILGTITTGIGRAPNVRSVRVAVTTKSSSCFDARVSASWAAATTLTTQKARNAIDDFVTGAKITIAKSQKYPHQEDLCQPDYNHPFSGTQRLKT